VKQSEAKQNKRNAEPALKGWFSGFGKEKHAKPCSQKADLIGHFTLNSKIIPATNSILSQINASIIIFSIHYHHINSMLNTIITQINAYLSSINSMQTSSHKAIFVHIKSLDTSN
jgi:hypothetical protein